jgi:hypothetical protein
MLMYEPTAAANIVNACVTLHNMRLQYRVPQVDDIPEGHADAAAVPAPVLEAGEPFEVQAPLAEGRRVREQIVRDHFAG